MFNLAACLVRRRATAGLPAVSPSESADLALRRQVEFRVPLGSVAVQSDVVVLAGRGFVRFDESKNCYSCSFEYDIHKYII